MGAVREADHGLSRHLQPMTLVCYRIDHDAVLDLSTQSACEAAGVEWAQIDCEWARLAAMGRQVPSWSMAEKLQLEGAGAMLVPSFAVGAGRGDTNLVFRAWGPEPPRQVRVTDDNGQLPLNQRSWS